jgi:hypothetical protein
MKPKKRIPKVIGNGLNYQIELLSQIIFLFNWAHGTEEKPVGIIIIIWSKMRTEIEKLGRVIKRLERRVKFMEHVLDLAGDGESAFEKWRETDEYKNIDERGTTNLVEIATWNAALDAVLSEDCLWKFIVNGNFDLGRFKRYIENLKER